MAKERPVLKAQSSHSPLPRPQSATTSTTTVSEGNSRPITLHRGPPAALNHPHYHQPPHLLSLHHSAAAAAAAAAVAARHMQHQVEGNDASNKVSADSGEEEDEEINVQVRGGCSHYASGLLIVCTEEGLAE